MPIKLRLSAKISTGVITEENQVIRGQKYAYTNYLSVSMV